ncbi:MAG: hypothetical protein R2728_16130 [Chitinophagales bacterium]
MNIKLLIASILVTLAIVACNYGEVFKTYKYSDDWEIQYPPYMRKTPYVYTGAEFQVKNSYRDTYMFMREMTTTSQPSFLLDSLSQLLQSNLLDPRVEKDSVYNLNGYEYHTQYLTGLLQDKRMFYILTVLKNGDHIYHYSGWMFNHKRELWQADYEKSLHSWKALK